MLKNMLITLVRPNLKFSYIVQSPRLIKDKNLIEVQKRASKLKPQLKNIPYEERW